MARRTKVEAAETRGAILDAALKLFLEKGIARTTLEEIAREAGHTRGAVYHHFANKTELLVAMKDSVRPPLESLLSEHMNVGDPMKGIQMAVTRTFEMIMQDEHAMQVHTVFTHRCEFVEDMNPVFQRECQLSSRFGEQITAQFELARQKGQLREDISPWEASRGLHCFIFGLISLNLREPWKDLEKPSFRLLIDAYFKGLRPEAKAKESITP